MALCMTKRTCASISATPGSSPNSAAMSIGWSTWVTILVGSGMLTGTTMLSPNGKPNAIGNMLDRNSLCYSLVSRSARRAAPRSADIVGISLSDDMTPTIFG